MGCSSPFTSTDLHPEMVVPGPVPLLEFQRVVPRLVILSSLADDKSIHWCSWKHWGRDQPASSPDYMAFHCPITAYPLLSSFGIT